MGRLIDKDYVLNMLCHELCHPGAICPDGYCEEMREKLKKVPAVDAVPVVRCKDCRFATWYTTFDGTKGCFCGKHGSAGHTETDFCSYAEREEMD